MKIYFPLRKCHLGNKLLIRVGYMTGSTWPTESELQGIFESSLSQNLVFLWDSCVNKSVSCVFSWAFWLLGFFFHFVLFWCFSFLSYFIPFYPLEVCLFAKDTQTGGGSGWEWMWEETEYSRGRANYNRIYYVKKSPFSSKGKMYTVTSKYNISSNMLSL